MTATPIPVTGAEEAKKKPPKLIEKVIEKVEEVLTAPVSQSGGEQKGNGPMPQEMQSQKTPTKPTKSEPPKQQKTPEQAQMQGSLGGESEYVLPKGTTITMPDGTAFETQTESTLIKKGGEK